MKTSRKRAAEGGAVGIGTAASRVEGRLKVTGEARYASDYDGGRSPSFAYLRTSDVARGHIVAIDEAPARRLSGVIEILTHRNIGDRIRPGDLLSDGGYMGTSMAPLASNRVEFAGQIVAMVIAESFEVARDAAQRLRITYSEERPSATFGSPGLTEGLAKPKPEGAEDEPAVGNAAAAFAAAPFRMDRRYATPTQHHNPMELFCTTCSWDGDRLTIWEPSASMYGLKNAVAEQLGIPPDLVRTVSPLVGGAFGARGTVSQRTAIVALAAKIVGRPVRLEATRSDGFTIATYRAETLHRVRLAANADGRLQALIHEGWEISSRPDDYKVAGTDASTRLYACPNIASNVTIVHADRNTPGFMRSPPETPYLFALESAMDELAVELKMDPIELRRVNDTQSEPIKGLPYTSRSLMQCFDAGAAAFGWSKRDPRAGAMGDPDWLIGWGCASTMYPVQMGAASARVTLTPDATVLIQTAAHEIGTGVTTALALTAAGRLGVAMEDIRVEVGDSRLPPAPVAGGSNSTASICTVVDEACSEIAGRIARAAVTQGGPYEGADPAVIRLVDGHVVGPMGKSEPLATAMQRASNGAIEVYAENVPHGVDAGDVRQLYRGLGKLAGGAKLKDRIQFTFGAQFAEVRVHRRTREVRAARIVGAYAAGRIVNPKAAMSQLMGGQIWGVGSALLEATEIDRRTARYCNDDLAEYYIAVNADVPEVTSIIVPEHDAQVNALGIKGLGEIGNVGLNAALANAVYHATGVRVRELPIRLEKLLPTNGGM